MTVLLPDLSEFQPHADMAAIKAKNGGAAIIRACYGTSHPDHAFRTLRSHAAGFSFLGIYMYVVAGQGIPAQASAFCDIVGTLGPHEFPVMDLEEGDGDQSVRAAEWLTLVGLKLRKRPWLYSGLNYAETHGLAPIFNGPEIHTWVAAYGNAEPGLGHTLWQSTNGQTGAHRTDWPGAGFCDTSVYHGTLAELSALITSQLPPPPPKRKHNADGKTSLRDWAHPQMKVHEAIHAMALAKPHGFGPMQAQYLGAGDWDLPMPEGMDLP
jgi:hypothetical protein